MLRRVMIVVLLGCVGLTAGLACGTLFSGNQSRASVHSVPSVLPAQSSHVRLSVLRVGPCAQPARISQNVPVNLRASVSLSSPVHLIRGSPVRLIRHFTAAGLTLYGCVLFGLLAGLSTALGFLVPPRSSLTALH
jgi:hypothetical protein